MITKQILNVWLLAAIFCVSCSAVNLSKSHLDGRIVGGFKINITQVPWQVSLRINSIHHCGGSIISPKWIISAAHCTLSIDDTSTVKIKAGSSLMYTEPNDGTLFAVKRIIQHEKYKRSIKSFDISLIELEKPLQLDKTKQVIKLHNFDEVFPDNTTTLVSGWGSTHNESEADHHLRAAEVPLVNQKICQKAYESGEYKISPAMICAGFYEEGGKDACQGDSGGPLVAFSEDDGEPKLVGIVSWGRGCAKPLYPGVYTRILSVRNWIFNHTGI